MVVMTGTAQVYWAGQRKDQRRSELSVNVKSRGSVWPWGLLMIAMGKGPVKSHLHPAGVGWRLLRGHLQHVLM